MRTTWIILVITVLAGVAMYFIFNYETPPGEYDTIKVRNTDNIVAQKIKIYQTGEPTELYFMDSTWMTPDSVPLKKLLDGSNLQFTDRRYASQAIILTYDNRLFYDLVIDKEDTNKTYEISFRVQNINDSFYVSGIIDKNDGYRTRFEGPMLNMYREFIISYNNRLPKPPSDSTQVMDSLDTGPKADKTITVLRS